MGHIICMSLFAVMVFELGAYVIDVLEIDRLLREGENDDTDRN